MPLWKRVSENTYISHNFVRLLLLVTDFPCAAWQCRSAAGSSADLGGHLTRELTRAVYGYTSALIQR